MFLSRSRSSASTASMGGDAEGGSAPPDVRRQQYESYVTSELSGLRERLLAKYEQGLLLPASSQRAARHSTLSSGAYSPNGNGNGRLGDRSFPLEVAQPTDSGSEDGERSARSSGSSVGFDIDDEEPQRHSSKMSLPTWQSNWSRLTTKLMKGHHDDSISVADLTLRVLPADDTLGSDEEVGWSVHDDWLKADVRQKNGMDHGSRSCSSFAASLVAHADTGEEYSRKWTTSFVEPSTGGSSVLIRKLMVHPDSTRRFLWALVGAALLMWDAVTIPLESVALLEVTQMMVILGFVYWSADLLVQGFTGYSVDGRFEMRLQKTMKRYARTWFPLDLSVLILDALLSFFLVDLNSSARTVVLLRLLRLVRLARLHKWLLVFESCMRSNTSKFLDLVIKIGRLMLLILMMCHYVACAWYWVGLQDTIDWGVVGSWIDETADPGTEIHKYWLALHWAITQFTPATNNIVPSSTFERVFAVGVVLLGMLAFSVFLSSITATVNELQTLNRERTKERFQVGQFIRSKSINASLGSVILMLFDADYNNQSRTVIESDLPVLKKLPESVRVRMHREYFLPYLKLNRVLDLVFYVDQRCFLHISHEAMSDHRFLAQQEVFLDGVDTDYAYVIASGRLKYNKGRLGSKVGVPVYEDVWLAEAALWVNWTHRGSLVASSCAEVVKLDCIALRRIAVKASGSLVACMRCCAVLFAHQLEEAELEGGLTDLGLTEVELDSIATRSLRFCGLEHIILLPAVARGSNRSITNTSAGSYASGMFGTLREMLPCFCSKARETT